MLLKKLIFSLITIALCLQSFDSDATHIICGNISYEYVGVQDSSVLYKITINMYRDCDASTTPFDMVIQVGVYHADVTRLLYKIESLPLINEETVNPSDLFNGGWTPDVCIKKATYVKTILLPLSNTGFHLTHIRCCKLLFTNLQDDQGMTLYQFIPPANIINNSPFYSNHPIGFSCVKFPNQFNLGIDDIDGDSIVLKVATPTAGGSSNDPVPTPPYNLFLPLQKAIFKSSFSLNYPFGTNSYASLNSDNGDVSIYCPNQGYYCIAVDMKEFRNGVMISQSRFDVAIISLLCNPNMLQMLNPIKNKFEVYAGDSLEIPIQFYSASKYVVKRKGDIFGDSNSGFSAPFAIMDSLYGKDTLETVFKWQTSCNQAREEPYTIQIEAISEDTFIQSIIRSIEVKVLPFSKPESIAGKILSCKISRGAVYSIQNYNQPYAILWEINGGAVLKGQNSDSILVLWDTISPWYVKAYLSSPFGCGNDSIGLDVYVGPYSKSEVIIYDTICRGEPVFLQGKLQTKEGVYVDTIDGLFYCDSIITTHLAIKQLDVSVIKYKDYFTVKVPDAQYQWYSCPSAFPIAGANGQDFYPAHTGIYAVIISYEGCTDTSACYSWPHSGVKSLNTNPIKIYPNPATGSNFFIDLGHSASESTLVEIYNMMGQKMLSRHIDPFIQIVEINNISHFQSGIYIVHITNRDVRKSFRLEIIR